MASLSAFAGCTPVVAAHEGARAVPVEPLACVSVTVWSDLGIPLPAAGRWMDAGSLVIVWVGPGHFMVQRGGEAPLLPEVAALVGDAAALIDLTDARATLRLSGPAARDILAAFLPIDLHPRAFAPGHAATTVAGHLTVQVRQVAADSYDLAVSRSFAGSLWRALELAGAGRLSLHPGR